MHPARVSNAEVRALIRELMIGKNLPSGAAVRAALRDSYGSRGGVARIYRLLADERVRLTPPPPPGSVEALQREVEILREKLARSEDREYAHQSRWAEEVDQLRIKLAALEPLAQQARVSRATDELLRHRLKATELRAAALEQRLCELTRDKGEGAARLAAEEAATSRVESPDGEGEGFRV